MLKLKARKEHCHDNKTLLYCLALMPFVDVASNANITAWDGPLYASWRQHQRQLEAFLRAMLIQGNIAKQ